MDILSLILLAAILIFAHTVETVLGFGATMIAIALGIYILPLDFLLPVLVILAILQSAWLIDSAIPSAKLSGWPRHLRSTSSLRCFSRGIWFSASIWIFLFTLIPRDTSLLYKGLGVI